MNSKYLNLYNLKYKLRLALKLWCIFPLKMKSYYLVLYAKSLYPEGMWEEE